MANDFDMDDASGDTTDLINVEALTTQPKSMSGDEGSVVERSMYEVVLGENRSTGNTVVSGGPPYGIRFIKTVKDGTV